MSNNWARKWRPAWLTMVGWMLASTLWCSPAVQADPIFHSVIQAVNDDGTSAWNPVAGAVVRGIVINNPGDMLDYRNAAADPAWQIFIQAYDPDHDPVGKDYGGTALYMRREKPSWMGGGSLYTPDQWQQEMDRLNYPAGSGTPILQRGDWIEVTAGAPGLFYGGKFNINEQHSAALGKDFNITILGRNLPLEASSISLSDIKDASDSFIFDSTRQSGAEHYQGSLVRLEGLTLVDPDKWARDGTVTVRQGDLTMPLKLGLDDNLLSVNLDAMKKYGFSLTAIMDQEDSTSPYTGGYRLWLTNAADLDVVPEPGTLILTLMGGLSSLALVRNRTRRRRV